MRVLLSLIFLIFMSLANASVVSVSGSIKHCLMGNESMEMPVKEHLSKCNDISCAQHSVINKKVIVLENYTPQVTLIISIIETFYLSFPLKVDTPPPIV